jgi:hypothetical protein
MFYVLDERVRRPFETFFSCRDLPPATDYLMYRAGVKAISCVCLLTTFWSVLRVFDTSIFEVLAPIVILCALPLATDGKGVTLGSLRLALTGIALLTIAGIISAPGSFDPYEHILKVIKLVGAFSLTIGVAYVLASRNVLTVFQSLFLLCLSAAASSAVAILQGAAGILTGLIPRTMETGSRMTGFAEHPLETGLITVFGIVIALGLAMHTRKWLVFLVLIAVDIYSLKYSASLTAVFTFLFASLALCWYAKAYKIILTGAVIGAFIITVAFALSDSALGPLTSRLTSLATSQGNYATVQTREMQLGKAIALISPGTLVIGNGYSTADLPYNMDIHNGLVAAVFHFGLLGLVSQCFLISFFVVRMGGDAPRLLKSILLGCIVVFTLIYMSGPPQARPTLWAPLIILGTYLSATKRELLAASKIPAPSQTLVSSHTRIEQRT